MRDLLLVRHGQTDWNVARRFQGQTDTALNEAGRLEMAQIANALPCFGIERVVSSPLKRARDSAEILARQLELPCQTDTRLGELHLGAWQGQPYSVRASHAEWFYTAPHGGESGDAFCERLDAWLSASSDGVTLVVTHGLVIQAILMLTMGGLFDEWHSKPIKNGGFTRLQSNGVEWTVSAFNKNVMETNLL